jgi:hypothetical protein
VRREARSGAVFGHERAAGLMAIVNAELADHGVQARGRRTEMAERIGCVLGAAGALPGEPFEVRTA